MELFNTSIGSPVVIIITVVYFFTSSIEIFDIRITQAQKQGIDEESLPHWVTYLYLLNLVIGLSLILLNWKYAILVFIIRFILKVLPVLETIGNMIMAPFKKRK